MKLHWADGNGGRREIELGESYGVFVGANSYQDGANGLVPAPEAGDQNNVLHGDGTWAPITLDVIPSTLEGAMWLDDTEPDPEYNYEYDPVAPYGIQKFWLPFTDELTDDVYWNVTKNPNKSYHEWMAYGSPKIENGKFKTDGNSHVGLETTVAIGGQDFTIDCWAQMDSAAEYRAGIIAVPNFFVRRRNEENQSIEVKVPGDNSYFFYIGVPAPLTERFHLAVVYHHPRTEDETGLWQIFFNGTLLCSHSSTYTSRITESATNGAIKIGTNNENDITPRLPQFTNGSWYGPTGGGWGGTFENFRYVDGVALWSEDFTPPDSYAEYAAQMNAIPDSESIPAPREHPAPEPYLKIWLPFDESTDTLTGNSRVLTSMDKCGNYWWASYGTAINSTNAVSGNALELKGGYIRTNDFIEFGGADFGIDFYGYFDGESKSGAAFFAATEMTTYFHQTSLYSPRNSIVFGHKASAASFTCYVCNARGNRIAEGLTQNLLDEFHHIQIDYYHAQSRLKVFIDEQLATTIKISIARAKRCVFLGMNPPEDVAGVKVMTGTIDEFKLYDGRTIYEYVDTDEPAIPAEDVWRYENPGTADTLTIAGTTLTDLPETQSRTGSAFYQTAREKCFDLPATAEVWIKFDVFFNGSNRWRAYDVGTDGTIGITAQTNGDLSFFANNTNVQQPTGICKTNTLQTVLLHMISGSSNGVIEAWVDGTKIYRYSGDVNHGEDFADIYLQSDGAGTFFSNVIISNAEP